MVQASRRAGVLRPKSVVYLLQSRSFVHCNVVSLVALDFVLRFFLARVMRMTLVRNVFGMHSDNFSTDSSGLRIPCNVITKVEFVSHGYIPDSVRFTQGARRFAWRENGIVTALKIVIRTVPHIVCYQAC